MPYSLEIANPCDPSIRDPLIRDPLNTDAHSKIAYYRFLKFLFNVLTIKQIIENVIDYRMHHHCWILQVKLILKKR